MEVVKSPNDKREYRNIILPNRLEAILISDPETHTGAASMTVHVGHYYDPPEYLGLAHFLEHMLFMGTEKYKDENYYNDFLNKHGGSSNAFTGEEITTYFFDVHVDYFEKALDIFAQFFVNPLLKKDSVDREINAVDSEHSKNINSDMWRLNRILQSISRPEHPFHKFGTGNLETLKKDGIRDALLEFYNKYYSANLMKLVIIWDKPLDVLEKIVKGIFSDIKNKNVKRIKYNGQPFNLSNKVSTSQCLKLIKLVPISNDHTLHLYWQLPNMDKYYHTKPLEYLANLLGHESEGSILYLLKKKGWATSLFTGEYENDDSMIIYVLSIELTKTGLKYVPSIIEIIYNYIELVASSGIKKWLYDEIKTIRSINFDYIQKIKPIDYVVNLSVNMVKFPTSDVLQVPYMFDEFKDETVDLIKKCLSFMNRDSSIVIISSKKYKDIVHKTEKYYGINYLEIDVPVSLGNDFIETEPSIDKIHLPKENIFIPKNINLLPLSDIQNKHPIKLDTKNIKYFDVWYKKDNIFRKPKILINVAIFSPEISKTVENFILCHLYIKLFEHEMNPYTYYAFLANSKFGMNIYEEYIQIYIDTYRDTVEMIIKKMTDTFFNMKINKHDFDMIKEDYKKNLKNFIYNPPYLLAIDYLKEKTYNHYYTHEELLGTIDGIDIEQLDIVKGWFKKKNMVKCLIQGDIDKKQSLEVIKYLNKFVYNGSTEPSKYISPSFAEQINEGEEEIFRREIYNKDETDSVIHIFYEIGNIKKGVTPNWDDNIVSLIIVNILTSERFFNKLRSIEQSGYIVKSRITMLGSVDYPLYGLSYFIQSSKKNPDTLRKRIKKFVKNTFAYIEQLDQSQFKKYLDTLIKQYSKNDNNLNEEFGRNFEAIFRGDYLFDIRQHYISILKKITREDILKFYNTYFSDKHKRKLRVVKLYNTNHFSTQIKD